MAHRSRRCVEELVLHQVLYRHIPKYHRSGHEHEATLGNPPWLQGSPAREVRMNSITPILNFSYSGKPSLHTLQDLVAQLQRPSWPLPVEPGWRDPNYHKLTSRSRAQSTMEGRTRSVNSLSKSHPTSCNFENEIIFSFTHSTPINCWRLSSRCAVKPLLHSSLSNQAGSTRYCRRVSSKPPPPWELEWCSKLRSQRFEEYFIGRISREGD